MISKMRHFIFFILVFFLSGCEFLDAASYHFYDLLDKTKALIGLEDEQVIVDPEPDTELKPDPIEKPKSEPEPEPEVEPQVEEIIKPQKEEEPKPESKPEPKKIAKENTIVESEIRPVVKKNQKNKEIYSSNIPLKPLYHFGGEVTLTHLDDKFFYTANLRRVSIFDYYLNEVNSYLLDNEPLEMNSYQQGENRFLVLKTAKQIFRLKISAEGEILSQDIINLSNENSFGPFIHSKNNSELEYSLVSVFPQNIEFFSLDKFKNLSSKNIMPLDHVSQVFAFGDFYYLSRRGSLNILDRNNYSILSEIDLEQPFEIIGLSSFKDHKYLVIGYPNINRTGSWNGIRFLKLATQGRGIVDLGNKIELSNPTQNIIVDYDQPYVYLIQSDRIRLYSLVEMNFSQDTTTGFDEVKFAEGSQGSLFITGKNMMGRLEYEVSSLDQKTSDSYKLVFRWKSQKLKQLISPIHDIVLVGKNKALAITNIPSDGRTTSPVFSTDNLSQTMKSPKIITFPLQSKFDFTFKEIADYGVFLYDKIRGRTYLVNRDLTKADPISLASQKLNDLESYYDGKKDYIILSSHSKPGLNKNQSDLEGSIVVYNIESVKVLKKVSSLNIKQLQGFKVLRTMKKMITACGNYGVCTVDFNDGFQKLIQGEQLTSSDKGSALDILVSPREDLIYVYYEKEDQQSILILRNYQSGLREAGEIKFKTLSLNQFKGITFSKGGQKLLVPHDQGVSFYNVSDPQDPRLEFIWDLGPAFSIDVTNRGQDICVALGENGVECASYSPN